MSRQTSTNNCSSNEKIKKLIFNKKKIFIYKDMIITMKIAYKNNHCFIKQHGNRKSERKKINKKKSNIVLFFRCRSRKLNVNI